MFFRIPDWLGYEIQERWERLQHRWEQLAVRRWINKNPRIIIGVTCASVFVLLVIVIWQLMPGKHIKIEEYEKEWFYDLNTGELFTAKIGLIPPIEAPSGLLPNGEPAGVRAYVFSYSYEPSESERFIGFLEIPDPNFTESSPYLNRPEAKGAERWGQGRLIRRVDDEQWVPANSDEGQTILRELFLPNEDGEQAQYCPPK